MASTLLDARSLLEGAGYVTVLPSSISTVLHFEDTSVLGALHVLASVEQITRQWEELQDSFLRENATRLAFDPLKAWNCYTVLLTPEVPAKSDASRLFAIEENFRGTRKLVRSGVTTRPDVEAALAPLLPLRRLLSLRHDDAKARLASRLGGDKSPLRALLSDTDPNELLALLTGDK